MDLKEQKFVLLNDEKRLELIYEISDGAVQRYGQHTAAIYLSERQFDTSKYFGDRVGERYGRGENRWIKFELVYKYKVMATDAETKQKSLQNFTGMIQGLIDSFTFSWVEIKHTNHKINTEHYKTYLKNRSIFAEFLSSLASEQFLWEEVDFKLADLEDAPIGELTPIVEDFSDLKFESIAEIERAYFTAQYYKSKNVNNGDRNSKDGKKDPKENEDKKTVFFI